VKTAAILALMLALAFALWVKIQQLDEIELLREQIRGCSSWHDQSERLLERQFQGLALQQRDAKLDRAH
jgi:hypothetical protein